MNQLRLLLSLLAIVVLSACEKAVWDDVSVTEYQEQQAGVQTKKFTFTIKGDFKQSALTRASYLVENEVKMTDLWVFDYLGDSLVQYVRQSPTDSDWGTPTLQLTYGTHDLYFVASRGEAPTVDVDKKTIAWQTARDTFWAKYEVTVVKTSNGNRSVSLDRVVTKLSVSILDRIPDNIGKMVITPEEWYYDLNYTTGFPVTAVKNRPVAVGVPQSYAGSEGRLTVSIFGISGVGEWTTDVSLQALSSSDEQLGEATLTAAPFVRNRATNFSGYLFAQGNTIIATVNDEWEDPVFLTW